MKLTPWDSDSLLITLFAATGVVKDALAQSLMLIGKPGQGKTTLIRRLISLPTVKLISDVTSDGLRTILDSENGKVPRHLGLPEFMRLYSRDFAVASQAANLLTNIMTGDAGIEIIGRKEYDFTGKQVGIIGAMTTAVFSGDLKKQMSMTGLLSRIQVIKIERSEEETERVMLNMVNNRNADLSPIKFPQLRTPRVVTYDGGVCSSALMELLLSYEKLKVDERLVERFKMLLRASALLSGREATTLDDVHILERFVPYFCGDIDVQLDWPYRWEVNRDAWEEFMQRHNHPFMVGGEA